MTPRTPRDLLTPAALHVLLSLAEGERHGYGIKLDVEERTAGAVRLAPATLYEAIHRLETSGATEASRRRGTGSRTERRRRYYRLTAEGRERLAQELERLREIVTYAEARDLIRDPEAT